MKQKIFGLWIVTIMLVVSFVFPINTVLAMADWGSVFTNDSSYVWTVQFDNPMNTSTMNSQNIYVSKTADGYSRIEGVQVTADSQCAKISPPAGGWIVSNPNYIIITQKVLTSQGRPLNDIVRMKFTVYKDTGVKVYLENQKLSFDVPPQIINGRVMVPIRAIFEALGANIEWDADTRTVTAAQGLTKVKIQIGNHNAEINGAGRMLDTLPIVIEGRTFVPLRFIAEAFGNYIKWDGDNKSAYISAKKFEEEKAYLK